MPLLKLDQVVIKDLGIKQYQETFSAMKDFVAKGEDESIWMLEHDPVFTLGTAADQKHILKRTDIDIFQADRGGEVTYHGPGQLVIYFLLNIKKRNLGPKKFVKQLEDLVQKTLLDFQIQSNTIEGSPGVYVYSKKIASIASLVVLSTAFAASRLKTSPTARGRTASTKPSGLGGSFNRPTRFAEPSIMMIS